jgi:murein DD-endopeptidase MepM/ murein hydrolase activator NlpD
LEDDSSKLQKNIAGLSFRDLKKSEAVDEHNSDFSNSFLFVNEDIEDNSLFGRIKKGLYKKTSEISNDSFLGFLIDISKYVASRLRVFWVLLSVVFDMFIKNTNIVKEKFLRNMFWGRGGFLESTIQALVGILVVILGTSYLYRKPVVIEASEAPLDTLIVSENDLIAANTSLDTLVPKDRGRRSVEEYIVKNGDTISSIASYYQISTESILWANDMNKNDYIKPGDVLDIPPGNGVVITVKSGDTLASLAKKYDAVEQAIADDNWLEYPFTLTKGQVLFIPDGSMPVVTVAKPTYASNYTTGSSYTVTNVGTADPNVGKFLSWPVQGGAGVISQYYRGYYHRGVDIASRALPNIVAPASGTIIFAGCAPGCYCPALGSTYGGSGYAWSIQIDHGNGYTTWYGHLSNIYVRSGQSVTKGQVIGKMGSTGRSTGPHLHWELRRGTAYGTDINPLVYMK